MAIPKIVRSFSLFVDGRGYAGRVEECALPKLSVKTEEWRGGGMDAPAEIDVGMEKLECELTIAEHDPDLYRRFGLIDGNAVQATLRGALQADTGDAQPMVVTLRGMIRELDGGSFKAGEKGSLKLSLALRYYKLAIGGQDLIEIDVDNMRRVIAGTDRMQSIRTAIGM
jgi:hypothetical protein